MDKSARSHREPHIRPGPLSARGADLMMIRPEFSEQQSPYIKNILYPGKNEVGKSDKENIGYMAMLSIYRAPL